MSRRPMTPDEILVGRRLPEKPSADDRLLASFMKDGDFIARAEPLNRDNPSLRSAFLRARKKDLLRLNHRLEFDDKPVNFWKLTEQGHQVAPAARDRVVKIQSARYEWANDLNKAHKQACQSKPVEQACQPKPVEQACQSKPVEEELQTSGIETGLNP